MWQKPHFTGVANDVNANFHAAAIAAGVTVRLFSCCCVWIWLLTLMLILMLISDVNDEPLFGFIAELMTANMKCANRDEERKNTQLKGIENVIGK